MSVRPFVPKDDYELPDNYGMAIYFATGKKEEHELASHRMNERSGLFEFVTKDDIWNWVPMQNVLRVEFDKRFSKIVAIREKNGRRVKNKTCE